MRRRDFLRNAAAGSALIASSGLWAFKPASLAELNDLKYCFQSERELPVAYKVDVVVIGGSTAAVAAAVSAARSGAKVFLAAQEPYLGEDICGTYRFWGGDQQSELGRKLFGAGVPTPMDVKRTLDEELIAAKVDFLYSSYVTDLVTEASGEPAGVVISNRSGRQAIIAKTVIDATPRAMVARMSGAHFMTYPAGKQKFSLIVVGNDLKTGKNFAAKQLPDQLQIDKQIYPVSEYTLTVDMPDGSWASFANAEQIARDVSWDANQVDSGDLLFQVPPDYMAGQKRWNNTSVDIENINLKVFQPRKVDRLYVLGACADLSREAAENLLRPGAMIRIGERVGKAAAIEASGFGEVKSPKVRGKVLSDNHSGDIGELLDGLRPTCNNGQLLAENTDLPVLGTYDVIVMGGGTAGAPAALGAARQGVSTLLVEYLHGLGGIGTLGMIGRYFHGYKHGFTNEVDKGVQDIGGDNPRKKKRLDEWVFDWKTEWFRSEIRKAGGNIWFGVMGIGAYVENKQVKGVVVATPNGRGVVLAKTVIDSSGSADIAIAAGAGFTYTNGFNVAVQGAGLPPKKPNDFYNNTDWTFTDDSDMLDVWMTFVVGKEKFKDQFDIGKLPQTRERRRMTGDFTISVLDVYNGRTYPDTISVHESSFDTHGFTIDPFFALKPPSHSGIDVLAYVPFRSLLPKGIDGIVVTGLGASAHRDAMPVIRMQPCLQNQGYAVGIGASMAAKNGQTIRHIDIKALQKKLVEIGNMKEEVLTQQDNYPPSMEQITKAADTVLNDLAGLEILLWDTSRSVPVMVEKLHQVSDPAQKLVYARILGMIDQPDGWEELRNAVDAIQDWDEGWNYRGMGQFGKSMSYYDSLIIALGRTKRKEALSSVIRVAKMLKPDSYFSHFRAVALAFESLESKEAAKTLYELLQLPGVTGHAMTDIQEAINKTPSGREDTSTRNNSLRELILGRALYKVGDYNGKGQQILNEYSKDLRGHFYRHATGVLQNFPKKQQDVNL